MYVFETKRKGSWQAEILNIFSGEVEFKYFSKREFNHPKVAAESWAISRLQQLYGVVRADYVISIPHYITKLKWGGGVSWSYTRSKSRGKYYPCLVAQWTVFEDGKHKIKRKSVLLPRNDDVALRKKEHDLNILMCAKRAELTHSRLDVGVLSLEFDLDAPTRGEPINANELVKDK